MTLGRSRVVWLTIPFLTVPAARAQEAEPAPDCAPLVEEFQFEAREIDVPTRESLRGDLDFDAHGPRIEVIVERIHLDHRLEWRAQLQAVETKPDSTTFRGSSVRKEPVSLPGVAIQHGLSRYPGPAIDTLIATIDGRGPYEIPGTSADNVEILTRTEHGVVDSWEIFGDISGDDLGRVHVVATLSSVLVLLAGCEER